MENVDCTKSNDNNLYNMNTEIKDENFSFYHEYCRLFLANTVLLTEMRQLFNERN